MEDKKTTENTDIKEYFAQNLIKYRKALNLTQAELAEKLNITDRAVSKWECGKSLPDSALMPELCKVLEISINELLTGENLEMKD